MSPSGRRGSRRAQVPPTRLPDAGAHGVVENWEAKVFEAAMPSKAEPSGNSADERAAGDSAQASADAALPAVSDSESAAAWGEAPAGAEERQRLEWIRSQRPPHWG